VDLAAFLDTQATLKIHDWLIDWLNDLIVIGVSGWLIDWLNDLIVIGVSGSKSVY